MSSSQTFISGFSGFWLPYIMGFLVQWIPFSSLPFQACRTQCSVSDLGDFSISNFGMTLLRILFFINFFPLQFSLTSYHHPVNSRLCWTWYLCLGDLEQNCTKIDFNEGALFSRKWLTAISVHLCAYSTATK